MNQEKQKQEHPGHDETFNILVNGTKETFTGQFIGYDDVVKLAFGSVPTDPGIVYVVSYELGHSNQEGTLTKGGKDVKVKEGMIFHATDAGRS